MSSNAQQQMSAGQAHGQARSKTEDLIHSAKDSANSARDKTSDMTQSAKGSAQQGNEQSAGFLHQTGEQMVNMAQGAVDTMKNTLGMNEKK
uniref:Uncharacterized protein n=1 Tax=Kalanchoe fedtschenkoi TaxID=63787 RepID=A0A7N1A2G0_KALFE